MWTTFLKWYCPVCSDAIIAYTADALREMRNVHITAHTPVDYNNLMLSERDRRWLGGQFIGITPDIRGPVELQSRYRPAQQP